MLKTAKEIIDYVGYIWPLRKTKYGLLLAFIPIAIIWILKIYPLQSGQGNTFLIYTAAIIGVAVFIFLFWVFDSGRIMLPSSKFTIIFSLIDSDVKSHKYALDSISMLNKELDTLNLLSKFRIIMAGQDIIKNTEEAHSYREHTDAGLIIWGEIYSGQKEGKVLCDFKNLRFTFKIPPNIAATNLTEFFKSDINIALINRDWNVYEVDSLPDVEKISANLAEIIIFIVGVTYCQAREYAEESIRLLENLFAILEAHTKGETIEQIPEEKKIKMSPPMLRKSRVLGILLFIYKNIAFYFYNIKQYPQALFYYEKYHKYIKNDIDVLGGIAVCLFYLDNIPASKSVNDEIGKLDKSNEIYVINRAFFAILDKNYAGALNFYKEFVKKVKNVNQSIITTVIAFLDERKSSDPGELAYDFGIGLLNYHYCEKDVGERELRKFVRSAKGKPNYTEMVNYLEKNYFFLRDKKKGKK